MNKRYVKSLNRDVSEIGFGSWQLSTNDTWGYMTKEYAIKLVKEAYNNGVTVFDTAPGYGNGASEKILGEATKDFRENVIINTKVGHGPNGEYEFSIEGIRNSIKRSLENLQTTYLDSVIMHNPERYILEGNSPLVEELKKAKEEGLIKAYGFSIDSLEELKIVLENYDVDTIEIMFNIIHQEAKYLFDEIKRRGIFLLIKVPLDSGWLTGKYTNESSFTGVRARWDKDTKDERHKIINEIKDITGNENLVNDALGFILSFNQVSAVIPGTKNLQQLHSNISSSSYKMPSEIKEKLEDLYDNQIKKQNIPW